MSNVPLLSVESAPAQEPLTLAEVKLYLRIDASDEDSLLNSLMAATRESAERYLRRSLITRTLKLSFDDYTKDRIPLPYGPIQSISQVKTITRDGTESALASSRYHLARAAEALVLDSPLLAHRTEVTYLAGYGDTADVPADIKQALLSQLAVYYEQRGEHNAKGQGVSGVVRHLLDPFRGRRL